MKQLFLLSLLLALSVLLPAQTQDWQQYEPSKEFPYGQKHPDAPAQLDDFQPMIGTCDCKSLQRSPDGTWADTLDMVWSFKYILNGRAIQDQTWRENSSATSIRKFNPDSSLWVVDYHSFPGLSTKSSLWLGKKEGEEIVLKMPQKSPGGLDGISRLTFTNISETGFDWRGEWVNEEMQVVYPFWLIWCEKRKAGG
jgi:hypothetical protein